MKVLREDTQAAVWRLRMTGGAAGEEPLIDQGITELSAALDEAEAAPDCRVIVLSGTPGCFCKGMDLRMLATCSARELSDGVFAFADCLRRLRLCSKLTISVVAGAATGGGVGLAAAADVLLASSRAVFSLPELVLGLAPAVITPILLNRMLPQKIRLLALSGAIDAQRALELGLADQRVEGPDALEQALQVLVKQGLRSHPAALTQLKRMTDRVHDTPLAEALAAGAQCTAAMLADPERAQAIRGFLEGEAPPWFARVETRTPRPQGGARA